MPLISRGAHLTDGPKSGDQTAKDGNHPGDFLNPVLDFLLREEHRASCRLDTMAGDEGKKSVCSPQTWIALRVQRRTTSSFTNDLKPKKESRHHEDLHTASPQHCRAAKGSIRQVIGAYCQRRNESGGKLAV